jgi:hypothetical protein
MLPTALNPLWNQVIQCTSLINTFLMGSNHVGDTGGSATFSFQAQTIVSELSGWAGRTIHTDPRLLITGGLTWQDGSPIQSTGSTTAVTINTVPPYRTVIYIMKVRSSEFTPKTVKP